MVTWVMARATRILIVGGGYVGMYTALRLQKKLGRGEAEVTVVDPQPHMTYQPFLPEAAAGSIEPRHVVVPLRRVLRKCQVVTGRVTVDRAMPTARSRSSWRRARPYSSAIDVLVVAPGSVARTLPIPGLAEHGIAFKTIGEAIYLRNHVLARLDAADATIDPQLRRRLLTFVVVGGGYAGIEALGELEDMARYASKYYPTIEPRRHAVGPRRGDRPDHARGQPEDGPLHGGAAAGRGIEIYLDTRVKSMVGGHVELDDGQEFDADTIIWTAGVKPSPMLDATDLPRDSRGRVECGADLQVEGMPGVFCAGDCAAVPDLSKDDPEARTSPSAQHAVRQAKVLGDNVIAYLHRRPLTEYKHSYAGSVASLGLYKGVAEVYGVKLRGIVAWFMHRTYHVSRMPTWNRQHPDRVRLDGRPGPRP